MIELFSQPETWAALLAITLMEVVLGIDNLIFISITTNKLPPGQREIARRIGIALALILRLVLLFAIAWIVGLTATVFDLGISGEPDAHGNPSFETAFSWRDLILVVGGLFLVWKATSEIHHKVAIQAEGHHEASATGAVTSAFIVVIVQIILLDLVFSIDSILTAVGMTDHLPIMVVAVVIAVTLMYIAAGPLSDFVNRNPTVVMLALAFLLMIGMILVADGFGRHVPKGYIYAAMAFAVFVEALNMMNRRANPFSVAETKPPPTLDS